MLKSLPEGQTGWLAGLRDPYVARALALLHGDIARPWTVDELGREVGLSRSALADRFTRLIGVAANALPRQLAHAGRRAKAAKTSASLAQIAETVGYESEPRFPGLSRRRSGRRRRLGAELTSQNYFAG